MGRVKQAATGFCLALFLTASFAAPVGAEPSTPAVDFLDSMSRRAIDGLTDPNREEAEREQIFRELLHEAFNMAAIGRFVVGRYWRAAKEPDKTDFIAIFEEVIVRRFLPLFNQYSGEELILGKDRRDSEDPRHIFVDATFVDAEGTSFAVVWRVFEKDGELKIIDVYVEGVSMIQTLRSEYGSVMKSKGGLPGLIELLREKLKTGDFESDFAVSAQ